mmetsp:Transcript_74530/g.188414  ORF Transcript_74530/g.188414 Transcript_74530/m.188414 type:complete len:98 (+) Transcript_74530:592-885(+)
MAALARGGMPKPMSSKPSLVGDGRASKATDAKGAGKEAGPVGIDAIGGGEEAASPARGLVLKHTGAAAVGGPCKGGAPPAGPRGGAVAAMGGRALLL